MEALSVLSFVILLGFSYYGAQWLKEKEGNSVGVKMIVVCAVIIVATVFKLDAGYQKNKEYETAEAYREGYEYGYSEGYDDGYNMGYNEGGYDHE